MSWVAASGCDTKETCEAGTSTTATRSAELGEPVSFRVAAERQFLQRLTGAGVPAGTAELLITREWAILAGENDYTTDTYQQITGRPPRPVAEFLHEYRAEFA